MKKVSKNIKADEALRMAISYGVNITQFCEKNGFMKNGVKNGVKPENECEKALNINPFV